MGYGDVDDALHVAAPALAGAGEAGTATTGSPSRRKSWPTVLMRTEPVRPVTHTVSIASSTTSTGANTAFSPSPTMRTPRWPSSEKTSAERGTPTAMMGASVTVISQVTPSG